MDRLELAAIAGLHCISAGIAAVAVSPEDRAERFRRLKTEAEECARTLPEERQVLEKTLDVLEKNLELLAEIRGRAPGDTPEDLVQHATAFASESLLHIRHKEWVIAEVAKLEAELMEAAIV